MFGSKETKLLLDILDVLRSIRAELRHRRTPVTAVITQGMENFMSVSGTIKGLAPGASDSFFSTVVDANGNAPTSPVVGLGVGSFTADDSTVGLKTSSDGFSVVATASASAVPGGSFNLTWSAVYTDPVSGTATTITGKANIPYLAPAPATFVPAGAVLSQGSPAA